LLLFKGFVIDFAAFKPAAGDTAVQSLDLDDDDEMILWRDAARSEELAPRRANEAKLD
jgi:hypothetical protein